MQISKHFLFPKKNFVSLTFSNGFGYNIKYDQKAFSILKKTNGEIGIYFGLLNKTPLVLHSSPNDQILLSTLSDFEKGQKSKFDTMTCTKNATEKVEKCLGLWYDGSSFSNLVNQCQQSALNNTSCSNESNDGFIIGGILTALAFGGGILFFCNK